MGGWTKMEIDEKRLLEIERANIGSSWTRNEDFDKNGCLVIKDLYNPEILYHPLPEMRGQLNYRSKDLDDFEHVEVEHQVEGSLARYWHPQYRKAHNEIKSAIESIIGRKLYKTYYYDRFYFAGQKLVKHIDRDACEISVSVHISSNLQEDWPFFIKVPSGESIGLSLKPGDAVLYKGCERPHWRYEMPYPSKIVEGELYYHQIFFHYVLQDGLRAHFAYDRGQIIS
jgi:hypothetical protein